MSATHLIAEYLHAEYGFAADSAGLSSLERIVLERCSATRHGTSEEYFLLLKKSPVERQKLLNAVIVPETFFFRHTESFTALVEWARARTQFPLRILSAACSTGEEAYSIAMCLLDAGFSPGQLTIEACDVSAASLAAARRGFYTANAFRSVDLSWRDRYFTSSGQGWMIRPQLRDMVYFREGNLFAFNEQAAWDAIFCRNVLIYFSPERQKDVSERLALALAPGGLLFLGPAEPAVLFAYGWASSGFTMSFSCVRRPEGTKPPRLVPAVEPRTRSVKKSLPKPQAKAPLPALKKTAAPVSESLEQARRLADDGRLEEAQGMLDRILKAEPSNAEAHFLCGVVAEATERGDLAERHYRRTLYLAPGHGEALRHMALLLRGQGRGQAAEHLKRRAARHTQTS